MQTILSSLHTVLYILQLNYDVQEILIVVGSMQDESLQENGMQFGACGKPHGRLHSYMVTTKKNYEMEFHVWEKKS